MAGPGIFVHSRIPDGSVILTAKPIADRGAEGERRNPGRPVRGRRAYPGQRAGCPPPGTSPGGFPCSLSFARRRRSPAVSQQPRQGYAPDLPPGLPERHLQTPPEVPAATAHNGTHCARPVSTRFEPVSKLKDVTTPVPRVRLSVTLAGPAPSGSTGTSRLRQGCSRLPGTTRIRLPSAPPPCRDRTEAKVSHLHSK